MRRLLTVSFGVASLVGLLWLVFTHTVMPDRRISTTVSSPRPNERAKEHHLVANESLAGAPGRGTARVPVVDKEKVSAVQDVGFAAGRPSRSLSGRIVDDHGQLVETARVEARRLAIGKARAGIGTTLARSVAATEGVFQFDDLQGGEWELVAFGEGDVRSSPITVVSPANRGLVTLVLSRSAEIHGHVGSLFGAPIGDAHVYLWYAGMRAPKLRGRGLEPRGTTDDSGRFRLEHVMPSVLQVRVDHPEYAPSAWTVVSVAPGERAEVSIVLGGGGRILGSVDRSISDVGGRRVSLCSARGTDGLVTLTADDGGFVFEHLYPQDYFVDLLPGRMPANEPDLRATTRVRVSVDEGETVEVIFRVDPPILVSGIVRSNGGPLEGATVRARPNGPVPDRQDTCSTGPNGDFELALAGAGQFSVIVYMNTRSHYRFNVAVPEMGATDLLLVVPGGRIAGTVVSPAGWPLDRVPVTLQREISEDADAGVRERSRSRMYTDRDGRFDFHFLESGSYTVRSPDGFWFDFPPPITPYGRVLHSEILLEEGEYLSDLELQLTAEGQVSGTVVDVQGEPLQGAWVEVRDSWGRSLSSRREVRTDASGQFRLRSLTDGVYRVIGTAQGQRGESATVRVKAGETTAITVRLAPVD